MAAVPPWHSHALNYNRVAARCSNFPHRIYVNCTSTLPARCKRARSARTAAGTGSAASALPALRVAAHVTDAAALQRRWQDVCLPRCRVLWGQIEALLLANCGDVNEPNGTIPHKAAAPLSAAAAGEEPASRCIAERRKLDPDAYGTGAPAAATLAFHVVPYKRCYRGLAILIGCHICCSVYFEFGSVLPAVPAVTIADSYLLY